MLSLKFYQKKKKKKKKGRKEERRTLRMVMCAVVLLKPFTFPLSMVKPTSHLTLNVYHEFFEKRKVSLWF
jgi:hypothetical protein